MMGIYGPSEWHWTNAGCATDFVSLAYQLIERALRRAPTAKVRSHRRHHLVIAGEIERNLIFGARPDQPLRIVHPWICGDIAPGLRRQIWAIKSQVSADGQQIRSRWRPWIDDDGLTIPSPLLRWPGFRAVLQRQINILGENTVHPLRRSTEQIIDIVDFV